MTIAEIKQIIREQLPHLIATDPIIRDFIAQTMSIYYASKTETDNRFDRVLDELQRDREERARDREEQARKWEQQELKWQQETARIDRALDELQRDREEQARKWEEQKLQREQDREEQARKWDEQKLEDARKWEQQREETRQAMKRVDSMIGAVGARWGLHSEQSFRNGLEAILSESFGVTVFNFKEMDSVGTVFGQPEEVEMDIIIQNGMTIVCEIKSSMNKSDMYVFDRKAAFYAQHQNRTVDRKLVISPMVDQTALPVAQRLGIEVYSHAQDVENLG